MDRGSPRRGDHRPGGAARRGWRAWCRCPIGVAVASPVTVPFVLVRAPDDGGPLEFVQVGFGADEPPTYRDVAHPAVTVGMTLQVSDTVLRCTAVRHTVLRHALLSSLYGTGLGHDGRSRRQPAQRLVPAAYRSGGLQAPASFLRDSAQGPRASSGGCR
jgi:hypothetical protein